MSPVDSLEDTETEGPFRPGTKVDTYVVERRIGEGGMGVVYAARHEALDKPVVIKALSPLLAVHSESVTRFLREGRAASRIRHPHVVDVTDVGTHEGVPYMVMELLEGEDVASRLKKHGRLAEADAVKIMLPVCDAVATAHELGVLHRDLKPSNIFLAKGPGGRETPMVLDFGLAKIFEGKRRNDDLSLTRTAGFLGTPFYVSPEQAELSSTADTRSDQYSLGAILYELVSGRRTVEGGNPFDVISNIIAGRIVPLNDAFPDAPSPLIRIVERAMAHKPDDRYASVRELGRALLERADRATRVVWEPAFAPSRETKAPAPTAAAEPRSHGAWISIALAAAVLIAIVPLTWWWLTSSNPPREPEPAAAPPPPEPTAPRATPSPPPTPTPTPAPVEVPAFALEVTPPAEQPVQAAPPAQPTPEPTPEPRTRPRIRHTAPQPTVFAPSPPRPIVQSAPAPQPLQRGTNNTIIVR